MVRVILVLMLGVCAFACKQTEEVNMEIIVTGQIDNAKGDSIVFKINDEPMKLAVSEDGQFSGSFEADAGYYQYSYFREYGTFFINPGDSLHISFDTRQFDESMTYSGTAGLDNNYLAAKYLLKEELGKAMDMRTLYTLPEDSFIMALKQSEESVMALLNKMDVRENFKPVEEKNIKYEAMSDMSNYEDYHRYFAKDDEFEVSVAFKDKLSNIDYTNEADFKSIPAYRDFVIGKFSGGELPEKLAALAKVESQVIREKVVKEINTWLSPGTENLKQVIDDMTMMVSDFELKEELANKYEDLKNLTRGNISPGFEFKNVKDEIVSLGDLKGKNVYIDVWATWCGPCKVEIPHLKELESEYHDKNIEFVSISVDVPKDEQKWKDMVAEKELKGVQLMSNNGWDTEFVKSYRINGIPRFILLDSDGRIVTADAPRPSSKSKIKGMIDELLVGA